MKWCFLVNFSPEIIEFFGKFSTQAIKEEDECIAVFTSKITEYAKKQYFPKEVKIISKVDWCIENYEKGQEEFPGLSWKKLFPDFDRFKIFNFTYNNSLEIVSQIYKFIDSVLQKEKPDVVLFAMPGTILAGVCYHLCKKYNITYLGLVNSILPRRTDVYDQGNFCFRCEKTFKELSVENILEKEKNFIRNFIRDFISHKKLPSYVDRQAEYVKAGLIKNYLTREIKTIIPWFQYFLNRSRFKPFDYESEILFKYWILYPWRKPIKRRFRALLQKNIFDSFNGDDKFFLFPLHVEPELSISFLATYFSDQLNTIQNIAFSLPFPYKLYVKEHPLFKGERPTAFYKKLKRIPNVVLVSADENVESLIKKSKGVITLTSTVGMEAALGGKPVYVLGDAFYSFHPLCKKVNNFEELKQKIEKNLIKKPKIDDLDNINLRFIFSYFKNTIEGSTINADTENDTNDYKTIYEALKRYF